MCNRSQPRRPVPEEGIDATASHTSLPQEEKHNLQFGLPRCWLAGFQAFIYYWQTSLALLLLFTPAAVGALLSHEVSEVFTLGNALAIRTGICPVAYDIFASTGECFLAWQFFRLWRRV